MDKYVVPKCKEVGTWYYYLEGVWKKTGEGPLKSFDRQFDDVWPWFCKYAVEGELEIYYYHRMVIELLEQDPDLSGQGAKEFYEYLREKKIPDAVPVLVERLIAYRQRIRPVTNTETENDAAVRYVLSGVMSFAESRHVDLLIKYIDAHPALIPLNNKLAEVKVRPITMPMQEPPFPPKGQENNYRLKPDWKPVEDFSPSHLLPVVTNIPPIIRNVIVTDL